MPRRTPTEELQDGDSQSGSPLLRRSTRIAQSAPASPAGISTRRSSADLGTPGKITKAKRLSLTQESSHNAESAGTPKKRSFRSASKSPTSLAKESDSGGTPLKGRGRRGSISRLIEEESESPRAATPIQKTGSHSSRSDSLSPTLVKERTQGAISRTRRGSEKTIRQQSIEEIGTQAENLKRKTTKGRKLSPILDTIEEKANTSRGELVEKESENILKEAAVKCTMTTNDVVDSSASKNREQAKESTLKSTTKETDSKQVDELNKGKFVAKDIQLSIKKEEITCVDKKNLPITKEDASCSIKNDMKENIVKTILTGDSKRVHDESNKEDKSTAEVIHHSNVEKKLNSNDKHHESNEDITQNDPVDHNTSLKKAKLYDTIAADITPSKEQDDVNVSSSTKKQENETANLLNEEDPLTSTKTRNRLSLKKNEENETKQTSTKKQSQDKLLGSVLSNKGEMTVGLDGSFELHLSLQTGSQETSDEELEVSDEGASMTNVFSTSKCSNKENSKNTFEKSEERLSVEKQKIACLESDKFRKSPKVLIERFNMQTNLSLQNVSVEVERIDIEKVGKKDHQKANFDESEKGLKVPIKPADGYFEKSTETEHTDNISLSKHKSSHQNETPNEKYEKPLSRLFIENKTVLASENESSGVITPNSNNETEDIEVGEEAENSLMGNQKKKCVDQQSEDNVNQEERNILDNSINQIQAENLGHDKIEDKLHFEINDNSSAKASNDKIIEEALMSGNVDEMSLENINVSASSISGADEKVKEPDCHENTEDASNNANGNSENVNVTIPEEEFAKDSQECEINAVVKDVDNDNNDKTRKVEEHAQNIKGSKHQLPNPIVSSYEDQIIDNENDDKSDNNQIEMDTTSERLSKCNESENSTDEHFNQIYPEEKEKSKEIDKDAKITKDGIEGKNSKSMTGDDLEHAADIAEIQNDMETVSKETLVKEKEKINIVTQNKGICKDESANQNCKNIIEGDKPLTCALENQITMKITSEEEVVENTNLQVTTEFTNETMLMEEEASKSNKNHDDKGLKRHESFHESTPLDNAKIQEFDINKSCVKIGKYQSECENGSTNEDSDAKMKNKRMLLEDNDGNKICYKVDDAQNEEVHGNAQMLQTASVNVEEDLQTHSEENIEKLFICSSEEKGINIPENVNQEGDDEKDDVNIKQQPVSTLHSKLIALIADVSESSSSDEERVSGFIDDMCEEGEEDTPSEGSNDISCKGESLHSDDTEEDTDDDYEEDSFIDDAEDAELLSGNDDLMQELKPSPKKTKTKYSRIIEVSDSEDELRGHIKNDEKSMVSDEVETDSKIEVDKFSGGKSIESKECESDDHQKSTKLNPSCSISHEDSNSSSIQLIEHGTNSLIDTEDNLNSYRGKVSVEPIISGNSEKVADSVKVINVDSEDEEFTNRNVVEESFTEKGMQNSSMIDLDTSLSQKQSKSKSSINIQENINLKDIKDGDLSERITKVVDWFYSGIKNTKDISGNILLNVSLDYANATPNDNVPESANVENETLRSRHGASMDDILVTKPQKRLSCSSSKEASPKKLRQDLDLNSPMKRRRSKTESLDQSTQLVDLQLIETSHDDAIESNEEINSISSKKTQKIKNRESCSPLTNKGFGTSETKRISKKKQTICDDFELEIYSIPTETVTSLKKSKKKRQKISYVNTKADINLPTSHNEVSATTTNQQSLKKHINRKQLESNDNEYSLTVVDVEKAYLIPDSHDLVLKTRKKKYDYTDDNRNAALSTKLSKESGDTKDKESYETEQIQSNFTSNMTSRDKRKIHKETFDCYESGGGSDFLQDFEKINDDMGNKTTLSKKQKLHRTGRTKITCEENKTNKDSASTAYTNIKSENKVIKKNKRKLGDYGSKSSVSYFSPVPLEQLPYEESVTKQEVPKLTATNEPNKRKRNLLAPTKFNADSDWTAESFDVDISLPPKKKVKKQMNSDANSLKVNKNRKNDDWIESFANRDFKNKMLYDPKRIKREDTKMLLRTKHTHV